MAGLGQIVGVQRKAWRLALRPWESSDRNCLLLHPPRRPAPSSPIPGTVVSCFARSWYLTDMPWLVNQFATLGPPVPRPACEFGSIGRTSETVGFLFIIGALGYAVRCLGIQTARSPEKTSILSRSCKYGLRGAQSRVQGASAASTRQIRSKMCFSIPWRPFNPVDSDMVGARTHPSRPRHRRALLITEPSSLHTCLLTAHACRAVGRRPRLDPLHPSTHAKVLDHQNCSSCAGPSPGAPGGAPGHARAAGGPAKGAGHPIQGK